MKNKLGNNISICLKAWFQFKIKFLRMFMSNKTKFNLHQFKNNKLTVLNIKMLKKELIIEISITESCMSQISKFMKYSLSLVKLLYFLELLKIIKVFLIKILNMFTINTLFSSSFSWKKRGWASKKNWKFLKRSSLCSLKIMEVSQL